MAPKLSEEEIDDLIYLSRAGEDGELTQLLKELSEREQTGVADVLEAAQDESGATCLHMAAANGHSRDSANQAFLETVTHILSHLPATTPGTAAAAPSSSEEAGEDKELSSAAAAAAAPQAPVAYINRANEFGNTALHWACLGGHLETVQLLLSRGASPTLANAKDQIPLDMAAFNSHMAVVNYFLSQSKDLEGDNAAGGGLDGAVQGVEVVEEAAEEAK